MIWFTSDLHLGHANIIRHCDRPFSSADEMDDALIDAINERVGHDDTLYVLGDVSMCANVDRVRTYLARIECGNVRLVRGNHDRHFLEAGVSPYAEERDYLELRHEGTLLCCMHYPLLTWRSRGRGSIMLHGHIHASCSYNEQNRAAGVLRFDVGVDANGYAPVRIDDIIGFFDGAAWQDAPHDTNGREDDR